MGIQENFVELMIKTPWVLHKCMERGKRGRDEAADPEAGCQRETALMPETGAKPNLSHSFQVKVGLSRENPSVLNDSDGRERETWNINDCS